MTTEIPTEREALDARNRELDQVVDRIVAEYRTRIEHEINNLFPEWTPSNAAR